MWGAIASIAAPIIGGLFGSKKQSTTSEIDYVKMRKNAEKGGFNPLTALRAGGGAGFTTTHHPGLASGEFIAQALAGVGNVLDSIDPMRDATAKLEYELKKATLENLQADTAARRRASLGGVPVATGARNTSNNSPLAKLPVNAGWSQTPTVEQPSLTNPFPTSWGWRVNSNVPDAAAMEDRWGEVGGSVAGLGVMATDLFENYADWMNTSPRTATLRKWWHGSGAPLRMPALNPQRLKSQW